MFFHECVFGIILELTWRSFMQHDYDDEELLLRNSLQAN